MNTDTTPKPTVPLTQPTSNPVTEPTSPTDGELSSQPNTRPDTQPDTQPSPAPVSDVGPPSTATNEASEPHIATETSMFPNGRPKRIVTRVLDAQAQTALEINTFYLDDSDSKPSNRYTTRCTKNPESGSPSIVSPSQVDPVVLAKHRERCQALGVSSTN